MANTTHPNRSPVKSKRLVVSNNQPHRLKKPYPEFPLTPHPSGQWCKRIKTPHGWKMFYFGPLADWSGALERLKAEIDDLKLGRTPAARDKDGLRLLELLNRFLHFKRGLVATGELTMRSWYDYHQTGERLLKVFGKDCLVENLAPADFEKLRADYGTTWGPVRIGNEINRARMVFRYGFENALLDKPVKFGPGFQRPSRKVLRKVRAKARHKDGARMFTAEELRKIIDAAPQPMKSMVLLGINGGLNNMDVATLPLSALDLNRGIIDFPRAKTGTERRIPLWVESVQAIREWLAIRPEPKNPGDAHLVFLTKQRRPWYRLGRFVTEASGAEIVKGIDNPVAKSFRVLLDNLGINGRRNFLALRHGFRTVARGARDREAIDFIMGHSDESMAAHYIEDGLPEERLRVVTEFVRQWLFASERQSGRISERDGRLDHRPSGSGAGLGFHLPFQAPLGPAR
ncbi:MAG TPA: tyrosine-type recombinase/integrase [Gemmataceae bacterium]|nr:tyrosine-type recombinase/integrase [Gemmataceae bacterium]